MSLQSLNSNQNYTFDIGGNGLYSKGQGNVSEDLNSKKLERLAACCFQEQVSEPGTSSMMADLQQMSSNMSVRLARLWNFLFGDHEWYNEARASQLLKCSAAIADDLSEEQRESLKALFAQLQAYDPNSPGIQREDLDAKACDLIDMYHFVDAQLDMMPEVKQALVKGAKMVAALAFVALDSYLTASLSPKAIPLLGGVKAAKLSSQLLAKAAKDLHLPAVKKPPAKPAQASTPVITPKAAPKRRPRSQSV